MTDQERNALAEEVDRLRRERQRGARLLEAAMNQALLVPRLDEVTTASALLEETSAKVRSLIRFKATAFWLVAPDGLDFRLALCDPPEWEPFIAAETELLIDDGTVAWALRRSKALTVTAGEGRESLLLQGLVTPDRDLGLFVAVLDEDLALLPDLGRAFLTATLALTASTLHNLELYRLVRDLNEELRLKVDHLEATERERAAYRSQLELKVSEKTEENRAKDLFIANVSHEMRTPLNGILGMAELLADGALGGEEKERVEMIRREGRSLLRLINDVLDFSRLEASKVAIERHPLSVAELLDEIRTSLAPRAARKGLTLRLCLAPDIPSCVEGDRGRLRQVLVNLTDNAVKFTDEGEILLCVAVERRDGDGVTLRFSVRDRGIGITEEQQKRLFLHFSQGDASTTRRYGGTGLGLAISKRLVDLMGGTIAVESVFGEGSLFYFDVPFRLADGGERDEGPTKIILSRFPGARLLVVDDSRTNRRVAEAMAEKLGLKAASVASAEAALERLAREPFDLVLMDIQMPDVDGFEATARIRASSTLPDPAIPIVALTAGAFEGDRRRCLDAGMDGYLSKPILPDVLRRVIDGLLEARRPRTRPDLLDMELLRDRMGGDATFCLQIVETFAEDLEAYVGDARAALAGGDLERLRLVAHALKGAAANSAASALHGRATDLERRCRGRDRTGAARALEQLEKETAGFLTWWKEEGRGGWTE